jgi:glycosyltransferase involved in cell wall biosynthesis
MTERLRVAVFSPSLDAVSGVSTHARALLRSALAERFDLRHFQVGSEGRTETRAGRLARLLGGPLALARFLRRNDIDIVHFNTSMDNAYWRDFVFLCVARAMRRKVVNQVHGGAMPDTFFKSAWGTRGVRWFLEHSDAVTVLSQAELERYRSFVPRTPVFLTPNAIPVADFAREPVPSERHAPLRLVYIGRLWYEKGLFETLRAFALLRRAGRALHLSIAGTGPDEAALRQEAQALGIAAEVEFVGPVFGAEKRALWHRSDVLVFASYREGLPYSLLEAMACRVVSVVTPVGAVPEVVGHEREALLVAPRSVDELAAAIARLDDDRALLGRLAEAALQRVRRCYSLERLEESFSAIYEEVGRGQRRQPSALSA